MQTGSALGNESPNHPGLVGLFDDALMAARSWIASEVLLDDRMAAACSAIRLVPDASEGMSLALEACAEAGGLDGGLLVRFDGAAVRLLSSHAVPGSVVESLSAYGRRGSGLLPDSGPGCAGAVTGTSSGASDFLTLSLEQAGFRSFASFPFGDPGCPASGAICLLSRFAGPPRGDSLRRLGRAASLIGESVARRRESDEIAVREASLRAIVDAVADGIVTVDGGGRIVTANPAVGRILDIPADGLVGTLVQDLLPPRDRPAAIDRLRSARVDGGGRLPGHPVELSVCRADGAEVPVEVAVSEIEPGRLFTIVVRDISERLATDLRHRQRDRLASLGTLAAGLGHDMNNVLFPLRAHLNAIGADTSGDGAAHRARHLESVHSGVRYLQQLADGLHYLVNDAGHADGGADGAVVADWWRSTGPLLSRGLPPLTRVEASIPPGLPRVRITEHALTQAVLNLFVNAGEAMSAIRTGDEGLVRISARAAPDGKSILLAVTDNGPGMGEETRSRAFDLFFTTKVRGLGTGLGLAMVARAAREAGGEAWIESAPDAGTSVILRLPAATSGNELSGLAVALTTCDGRAAGFLESALAARGARIARDDGSEAADAWFIDPRGADPRAVRAWRLRRPGRTVVQLGLPHRLHRKAWAGVADCTIRSITDFDTLLAGVGRACSIMQRRKCHASDGDVDGTQGNGGAARADARAQEGDQPVDRARAGGGARARRR